MKSIHKIHYSNSDNMGDVISESVDLVVTSPPYPMIQMWDDLFIKHNKLIITALKKGDGAKAFDLMHEVLDPV